ncbi:MAG: hypothetical protein ABS36_02735 [Acidobacteria bacterium SCN 69-37]|nr:MAG: hypothetical protein ABS36_02735 [Acidobacteria bacterium SCN 69-37]
MSPASVLGRLVVAVLLGAVVAWIYRKTRAEHVATFPATLVLLAVLIAMVTQVIGDSVARAFSLVGALSIVRFRTVVRDTQDTAFVIFAVVVGMACGASDPRVALIGIVVVGVAAFAMKPRGGDHGGQQYTLELRVSSGQVLDGEIAAVIDTFVTGRRLLTIGTARQGIALDGTYSVQLRAGQRPEDLVRALNRLEGIQNVTLAARPVDEPQG